MNAMPRLIIRPDRITANTRTIAGWCRDEGLRLCAVTKVTCAHPAVVRAYCEAGVQELGDSRIENLASIRSLVGIDVHLLLLRLPMISQAAQVVQHSDSCLVSEAAALNALSEAAGEMGRAYAVILMVDLGDLREGVWADQLPRLVEAAASAPHLQIRGIGVNLACYGGIEPNWENMQDLAQLATSVCARYGIQAPVLSGGNSANLPLLLAEGLPKPINHLRVGESALLGVSVLDRSPLAGLHQDAFEVQAEIVELQTKPSIPRGRSAQNAFGETPRFVDRGRHLRAICAIGRQDVAVSGLTPLDDGVEVLGASSDHLILAVERCERSLKVGGILGFRPSYGCLLAASTSPYVRKVVEESHV